MCHNAIIKHYGPSGAFKGSTTGPVEHVAGAVVAAALAGDDTIVDFPNGKHLYGRAASLDLWGLSYYRAVVIQAVADQSGEV